MKVTAIKAQLRRKGRFSIFLDGQYSFSLGEAALLSSKLVIGQDIDSKQLRELQRLSADDVLQAQAERYASSRLHSRWELEAYLQRKAASPALSNSILNKLSANGFVDDYRFAAAYLADRQRLRPTSRRKIMFELRAKHVSEEVIQNVMDAGEEEHDEQATLRDLIKRKRQQSRYQDDLKLTQYLVRQGFNYTDVKAAIQEM